MVLKSSDLFSLELSALSCSCCAEPWPEPCDPTRGVGWVLVEQFGSVRNVSVVLCRGCAHRSGLFLAVAEFVEVEREKRARAAEVDA